MLTVHIAMDIGLDMVMINKQVFITKIILTVIASR